MKKSEKLKEELKTLTDSFAIRSMKQRIALAESKEKNKSNALVSHVMAVIKSLNETIYLFIEELMTIDHDEEIERTKELNGIIEESILISINANSFIVF